MQEQKCLRIDQITRKNYFFLYNNQSYFHHCGWKQLQCCNKAFLSNWSWIPNYSLKKSLYVDSKYFWNSGTETLLTGVFLTQHLNNYLYWEILGFCSNLSILSELQIRQVNVMFFTVLAIGTATYNLSRQNASQLD